MPWQDDEWIRDGEPMLHAETLGQKWCSVCCYSPAVIHDGDVWRMWFVGNGSRSRTADHSLGYAESPDGVRWTPHDANPILTPDDIPWGMCWQTPHVLWDAREGIYKMWFVAPTLIDEEYDEQGRRTVHDTNQGVGYATSTDGLHWDVCAEPLFYSGRRPCVIKNAPGDYRMWMNSRPSPEAKWDTLYANIYEFASPDGIAWERSAEPVVTPTGVQSSCVYPFVIHDGGEYRMLYGCHVPRGFEVYAATSPDGTTWTRHAETPAFASTRDESRFDGRYTSTPCVLVEGDEYVMYYSGRPLQNEYVGGDGKVHVDNAGVYNGIGRAVRPRC